MTAKFNIPTSFYNNLIHSSCLGVYQYGYRFHQKLSPMVATNHSPTHTSPAASASCTLKTQFSYKVVYLGNRSGQLFKKLNCKYIVDEKVEIIPQINIKYDKHNRITKEYIYSVCSSVLDVYKEAHNMVATK